MINDQEPRRAYSSISQLRLQVGLLQAAALAKKYSPDQPRGLAMQMIGAELYTSKYHASGQLRWDKPGAGYGFPLTPSLRHLLVDEDKKFDG